jgi:hypothetical protein
MDDQKTGWNDYQTLILFTILVLPIAGYPKQNQAFQVRNYPLSVMVPCSADSYKRNYNVSNGVYKISHCCHIFTAYSAIFTILRIASHQKYFLFLIIQ